MSNFLKVAEESAFKPNQPVCFSVENRSIAVVLCDGNYHAFDRACPHKLTPLDSGVVAEGKIFCPMHGWGFELATGACDTNPDKPLKTYPVRVQDGEVQIQIT